MNSRLYVFIAALLVSLTQYTAVSADGFGIAVKNTPRNPLRALFAAPSFVSGNVLHAIADKTDSQGLRDTSRTISRFGKTVRGPTRVQVNAHVDGQF